SFCGFSQFAIVAAEEDVDLVLVGVFFHLGLQALQRAFAIAAFPVDAGEEESTFRIGLEAVFEDHVLGTVVIASVEMGGGTGERGDLIERNENRAFREN